MKEKPGLLPSCWGPMMWGTLHSIAYSYDPSNMSEKLHYKNFFTNLGHILPCSECRKHYYEHFRTNDLHNALETNEGLFRWVYDLHNMVNRATGVPESNWPSYESIKSKYSSFKASCSEIPGMCTVKNGPVKRVKIIEQFGTEVSNDTVVIILGVLLGISILVNIVLIPKIIKPK